MSSFSFDSFPIADSANVLRCAGLRITVLTDRLIRIEKGSFTDEATQTVWNRNFPPVRFSVTEEGDCLSVKTDSSVFIINLDKAELESVTHEGKTVSGNFDEGNLGGTARTLDMTNGSVKLEKGLMSRNGVSIMDDSKSLILLQSGEIIEREKCRDIYCFAYGNDYRACLRDFYRLTGNVPLIPKFALGNWWSRYKAYTQAEYKTLMENFIARNIPITVATIDMDWHWTDVIERFGKMAAPETGLKPYEILYRIINPGWTGYSWNTELFPDHRSLLDWLHESGMAVTLNVHPSQGIRFFEDCYADVCKRLGRDSVKSKPVEFDLADRSFRDAYFELVHHPLEDEGVDFWWIDWQQGKKSSVRGLDPLWALNHYHWLDAVRSGKRNIILSRYSGLGSHRYPLGFSGDTVCSWESLRLQPKFTATAANAGYTWWSHDIGGHYLGEQNDELYVRWIQFGVFSPVNRLHSSNNECMGKEPWKRSFAARMAAENFLRLRHKLIPYINSINHLTHYEGRALCEPMYYSYDCDEAYAADNQYFFGTELLVCPITEACDKSLLMAGADVWLPEGRWTDVFNGRIYEGGQKLRVYRDVDEMPVFAKEGCILPMYSADAGNSLSDSQDMDILLWRGNGSFTLYEDTGSRLNMSQSENAGSNSFCIDAYQGNRPEARRINIVFKDIAEAEVYLNGERRELNSLSFEYTGDAVEIKLLNCIYKENPKLDESISDLFTRIQGSNGQKQKRLKTVLKDYSNASKLPKAQREAVEELLKMKY